MSQSLSKLIFQTQNLLSARIGVQHPFYRETACMDAEIREFLAYCEIVKIFFPNNKRLIQLIENKLKPSLEKLGIARWARTEITDLGLKIGYSQESVSLKYLEKTKMEDQENASSE